MANTNSEPNFDKGIVLDEIERHILFTAIRLYRHHLEAEVRDMIEDGNDDPNNPEYRNTVEWADRAEALKRRIKDLLD